MSIVTVVPNTELYSGYGKIIRPGVRVPGRRSLKPEMSGVTVSVKKNKPMKRRIAFFSYADVFEDFYPHYGIDQEAFASHWSSTGNHRFVLSLLDSGADVTWYETSVKPSFDEKRHALGFDVRFLRSSWLHRRLWNLMYMHRFSWRLRRFQRAYMLIASYVALLSSDVVRTLWRDRPDCIFVQDYASGRFDVLLLFSRVLRRPLLAYHSGSMPHMYLGRSFRRRTLKRADALIASSQREESVLREQFGVPSERIAVILTPIDLDQFKPVEREDSVRRLGLDPTRRYILFVGRFDDKVKRISTLIEAFGSVSSLDDRLVLLIVGTGEDDERLRALARQVDPERISLVGWADSVVERVALYCAAELLVLPSVKEGFPTVIGEAMACGTPVAASDVGGVSELVVPGATGWLMTPGSRSELEEILRVVATDEGVANSMRPAARDAAARHLAPSAVSDQLSQIIREAAPS